MLLKLCCREATSVDTAMELVLVTGMDYEAAVLKELKLVL